MEEENKNNKKHFKLKISALIIFIIVILLCLILVMGISFINYKLNEINYEQIDKNTIEITEEVKESLSGYRNVVLFGIDDVDGYTGRSDCIIIFSINENTKDVKMTSIYRDTYVEIPGHGYTKINHAYAYGGANLAMNTINRNLDLNITEYVTINFKIVKEIVDEIQGVTISVTSEEATQIPGITSAGTYTLTGEQALAYGRIRKIDTDYKRTERMRTVINAVFNKVKKMSISKINNISDKILSEIHTNVTKEEITEIIKYISSYNIENSIGWPYQVTGKIINKVWYGVPKTLKESVQKLHKELFEEENYNTSKIVNNINNEIIKKTGVK